LIGGQPVEDLAIAHNTVCGGRDESANGSTRSGSE
jgi:hypothetical protein